MCIYASFLLYFLYLPLQSWCFYSPSVHVSSYNVHFVIVKLLHCFGQRNLVHGQPQRINSWLSKYKQKNSLNIFPGWFISLPMLLPIETILTHDIVMTLCTCRCSIKWIINVVRKQPPAPTTLHIATHPLYQSTTLFVKIDLCVGKCCLVLLACTKYSNRYLISCHCIIWFINKSLLFNFIQGKKVTIIQ